MFRCICESFSVGRYKSNYFWVYKLSAFFHLIKLQLGLKEGKIDVYTQAAVFIVVLLLLCLSGTCGDGCRVFLWQSQTGSVGRRAVPLLSALSPSQSLRWSPLSLVKTLSRVQLHLCCGRHQVLLHSYRHTTDQLGFQWLNPSFILFLFEIDWTSWARLHCKTTVQLCGLWHCRCVAVLLSLDHSFERSFNDKGFMSCYAQW